ncbi:DinB family protein [Muriicola soli]|uniref:DinB family protein n=1 Tax=Muriicola soli TaxID=2507538 RepID=A0A411EC18_9FLAO|nr:DinB family protein [Muriicola soli]QBA65209.1 DinB family protein [Muriicola soli]
MENLFNITSKLHDIYHRVLTETPEEQLFVIPNSHKNNLFWNIAHALVTEQLLIYKLSKLPMRLEDSLIDRYSKGTFPEEEVSAETVKKIADALLLAPDWIKGDYEKGIFKEFNSYTTSAKVTLNCVEDAIAFNHFHLGLHYGTILGIKKIISTGG